MATRRWRGGAAAEAQVQTYAFGGTWEADDLIRITIGAKVYDFTAGSTTTATVVSNLVTSFNALDSTLFPEFASITASASTTTFILTADDEGVPFVATLTPLEANGGGADAQTIEGAGTATTGTSSNAATGPNHWDNAQNWKETTVPTTGDDVYVDEGPSIKYGLDQNGVTLSTLTIGPNFPSSSEIGLPAQTNPNSPDSGYPEYRDQRLKIGATTTSVETSSRRIRLDLSPATTTVIVRNTGQPQNATDDALDLKATTTANVHILKGYVGINNQFGDSGTIADLNVSFRTSQSSDAVVRCGLGCTTTNLDMSGGDVLLLNGATTITKYDGTLTISAGAVTTLTNRGGVVYHDGVGTITTLNNLATFIRRGFRAGTITTANLYAGSTTSDRNNTITWTNSPDFIQCRLPEGPDDRGRDVAWACFGTHKQLTVADI